MRAKPSADDALGHHECVGGAEFERCVCRDVVDLSAEFV